MLSPEILTFMTPLTTSLTTIYILLINANLAMNANAISATLRDDLADNNRRQFWHSAPNSRLVTIWVSGVSVKSHFRQSLGSRNAGFKP